MTISTVAEANTALSEALRLHQAGDLEAAAPIYESLLAVYPRHPQLLENLGRLELQRGRLPEAEQYFGQSLSLVSQRPDLWRLLADTCFRLGQRAEACSCYDCALALNPNDAASLYDRGTVRLYLQQWEAAQADFDRALALNPADIASHVNRGQALLELQRPEEALADFLFAVERKPDLQAAYIGWTSALQALHRPEEALTVFEQALAILPQAERLHFFHGNLLMKQRRFVEAIAAYDAALACRPQYCEYLHNRACALRSLGRLEEALTGFETAIASNAENAESWNNRASILMALQRPEEALASYREALERHPDNAEALSGHGIAALASGHAAEAFEDFTVAAMREPDHPEHLNNQGMALLALDRGKEALICFDAAVTAAPDNADFVWNKALALLAVGRFAEGWPLYEARWSRGALKGRMRTYPQPRWDGTTAVAGKTLFIHAEQGLGDTVQFCRYLPLLARRGARIVFEAPVSLHPVLKTLAGNIVLTAPDETPPNFDLHLPLLSLPRVFATTLETIPGEAPYLTADPARCAAWQTILGTKRVRRIGLTVSGQPQHENDRNRSLALERLAPLLQQPGEFHLLQPIVRKPDAKALAAFPQITAHTDDLPDFGETAALISQMDLVITVDTAVAHLAGALGRPVWILLPFAADWRWMSTRPDTPWYPTARLFRQPASGDWTSVIAAVGQALLDAVAFSSLS